MKKLSVVAIALSTLVAGHAMAADASVAKTREQVRAEVIAAQRSGDLVADGQTGATFNQVFPAQYAQSVAVQGKTRAEVKAELAEAIRTGDIVADGATGAKANELAPAQYAAARADKSSNTVAVGKTRAEVKAELAEAIRTGDIVADGATGAKANELFPAQYEAQPVLAGKNRDEVRAELVQPRRANGG